MTTPIILITGIMASGKSTIAQAVAERLPRSVHVRGDQFRRFIVNGREEMNSDNPTDEARRQMDLRQDIAAEVTRWYAEAGFSVVLQDIFIGDEVQEMVNTLSPHKVAVVVLTPSIASVQAREDKRRDERGKVGYREGGIGLEELDTALRTHTPQIGLWIDSTDLSVEETVDHILSNLDDAVVPASNTGTSTS